MIVLEFNELSSELISRFMARGLLPGFSALYQRSVAYTTDAGEEPPNLEPWIQWPSVHSGMTFSQHRVFNLGDGCTLREKCIAELLSDAGVPVGVFGSMNMNYGNLRGYFLPDPWHKSGSAWPKALQPYYEIISKQVQESSKSDALALTDMTRLGWFMVRNGLTVGTAKAAARQLLAERRDGGLTWRRASLMDDLQYDVFHHLNRHHQVRFATFFCNSTAHYQHYYWRSMQPEWFQQGPHDGEHASLAAAIQHGYQSMDRLIQRALRDYPDAVIVLCTALSQRPWDTTKCTYRPRDFESLLSFAGIRTESVAVKPVMAEQFHLDFVSAEASRQAEEALRTLFLEDRPLMFVSREGDRNLFCGCDITEAQLFDRQVMRRPHGASKPFNELFYMIHTVRSGRHDPLGSFWLGNGHHEVVAEPIPITDIAPTILEHFGLDKPAYMQGASVWPRIVRKRSAAA
jgi:hypothetical protein